MYAVLAVALFFDFAPVCVSNGKLRACGYQCVRDGKNVVCAQTPDGFCQTSGNRGACWDPAPDVSWMLQDPDVERPQCMASLREVACGFHCIKHVDGRVRCALTPIGVCHSNQQAIGCWDPAEPVRVRMIQAQQIVNAECTSFLDHIECGYHCTAVGTNFACAHTPWGACDTHFTEVACFDPPITYADQR